MSLRHRKAPGLPLGVQAARLKLPKTRAFEELARRADFPYILEFAQKTRKYFVSGEPDYFGGNEEAWMVTHTQRWFCCTHTAVRRPRNSTGFPL